MTTTASHPPAPTSLREVSGLPVTIQRRRAVLLLLFTLLLPGSAQLAAGNRRLGRVALRTWLGVLAAVVLLLAVGFARPTALAVAFTNPFALLFVGALFVVGAVGWAVLFADAWRLARPVQDGRTFNGVTALAALLVVATSGSMLYGASMVGAQRDLIAGVFGSGTSFPPVDGRYNVLLLGGDADEDRTGVRPDSITVASIDAATGSTTLFSLPRNLQEVPFPKETPAAEALPEGFSCGDECLLNALYRFGHDSPHLFPGGNDPGATAMLQAAEGITGLTINYYVLVELDGFRALIDAMGGIEIDVANRVPIGGGTSPIYGWIEPGRQRLDGYHALWFARSREGSSDYARMARQRCVMTAMVNQLDPQTLLSRFRQIAAATEDVISTNLPDEDLPIFAELGMAAKEQPIESVQFVPPLVEPAYPDYELIQETVRAVLSSEEGEPEARGGAAGEETVARAVPSALVLATGSSPAGAEQSQPADDEGAAPVDARKVCRAG